MYFFFYEAITKLCDCQKRPAFKVFDLSVIFMQLESGVDGEVIEFALPDSRITWAICSAIIYIYHFIQTINSIEILCPNMLTERCDVEYGKYTIS